MNKRRKGNNGESPPKSLEKLPQAARRYISENLSLISDDALIKIVRQIDFWMGEKNLSDAQINELVKRLVDVASWRTNHPDFKVPKVRFGKTELQMPIITCGGMRFQHTWMPDSVPIAISKQKVIKTASQSNILDIVRACLKVGINHFETARLYGTSEVQLMEALITLIESGEIKRSDFILQTKIGVSGKVEDFEKNFETSWNIFSRLGYIDLLSFWCVSTNDQTGWALEDGPNSIYDAALKWQQEGRIKHIGFSTHGTAKNIMKLIESKRFAYVNIHYHYFGSYHATGTDDTKGGHGNAEAVKRALELDMGVFNISPVDKGGKLYEPSATIARTIGPQLSPISFALLQLWKESGMHTASVGFARLSDMDEVIEAALLYSKGQFGTMKSALHRLEMLKEEKLGSEWNRQGLLDLPDCYAESTQLTIPGHVLWLHDTLTAFGMYQFANERYQSLENFKYNNKKSFEENAKAMPGGNIGRSYVNGHDYSNALEHHYDPSLAASKMMECHKWLSGKSKMTKEELVERGWQSAYTLLTWNEFPDTNNATALGVVLQNVTGGLLGIGGGPNKQVTILADKIRACFED